jgi:cell division septum initiation protein DivIVA
VFDLENVPDHLREWFEKDLWPEISAAKDRLTALEAATHEHAQQAADLASLTDQLVSAVDPHAEPAVAKLTGTAKAVAARAQQLLIQATSTR